MERKRAQLEYFKKISKRRKKNIKKIRKNILE